jgi:hypothetical protein
MADSAPPSHVTFNVVSSQISSQQKWIISIFAGLLFAIISSNVVYGFTNKLFGGFNLGPLYVKGGPTVTGLIIHTIVFILLVRLVMM